jgi:steroid 5-alpha reductase family enzyme
LANAAAVAAYVCAQWAGSLYFRDASLVDRYWGGGFALVALVTFVFTGEESPRGALLLAMAAVWGLRLSIYLTWRNWGQGEDYRYQAMRKRHGARFGIRSLFSVFLLQGALTWFISLPLQWGIAGAGPAHPTLLDVMGVAAWTAGFLFESIGDIQLARFKAHPANAGRVMDRGLWRYTRHPNYFGDTLVWWGMFLVAANATGGIYTVLSPVVMQYFLMRVSGVALLERKLVKTRPGYTDYVARTNAFFPWRPKKNV